MQWWASPEREAPTIAFTVTWDRCQNLGQRSRIVLNLWGGASDRVEHALEITRQFEIVGGM